MISVIFSTFNEEKLGYLKKSLSLFSKYKKEVEVICVDKNSSDQTPQIINQFGARLIITDENSRASRLNTGVAQASGSMILLHHPRSLLCNLGIEYLIANQEDLDWGGFTHCFDKQSLLLNFTSWYSNNVRAKVREIFYLDHCIFVSKELLNKVGGVALLDIFEDTELSLALASLAPAKVLPFKSLTSAIRFEVNGQWRQAFLNQYLKLIYLSKGNHQKMNKVYERALSLNSKY